MGVKSTINVTRQTAMELITSFVGTLDDEGLADVLESVLDGCCGGYAYHNFTIWEGDTADAETLRRVFRDADQIDSEL